MSAIERALPLFRPEYLTEPGIERRDGYLDVVVRDLDQQGIARELMQTTALSAVYERWWRPALGRAVKGVLKSGREDGLLYTACAWPLYERS